MKKRPSWLQPYFLSSVTTFCEITSTFFNDVIWSLKVHPKYMIANKHCKLMSNFVVTVPADGLVQLGTRTYQWFSARKTWLLCVSNGVASFLHLLINLKLSDDHVYIPLHPMGVSLEEVIHCKCSCPVDMRPNLVFIMPAEGARISEGTLIITILITSVPFMFHLWLRNSFAGQTILFKITDEIFWLMTEFEEFTHLPLMPHLCVNELGEH